MPHDAAGFVPSVRQRKEPWETGLEHAVLTDAIADEYARSAASSAQQYRDLTGVPDPVAADEPEQESEPDEVVLDLGVDVGTADEPEQESEPDEVVLDFGVDVGTADE